MRKNNNTLAFTLVEMLMALLIVSVILSASMPVITKRMKAQVSEYGKNVAVPIGIIAIWGTDKALPDNTWLECNGQAIPNGVEYEEIRGIYGANLPDYRGVFLRGYGSISHTKNNGSTIGSTATTHASGAIGAVQGDAVRNVSGSFLPGNTRSHVGVRNMGGVFYATLTCPTCYTEKEGEITFANLQSASGVAEHNVVHFQLSRVVPTSNEIRPVNTAVRYIIKVRH